MKILSWNILAEEWIDKKYYPMVKEQLLESKKRFKIIMKHIRSMSPDIILLQEVMKNNHKYLIKKYSHKYYISPLIPVPWVGYPVGESGNVTMLKLSKFQGINFNKLDSMNFLTAYYKDIKIGIVNVHLDDSSNKRRINQIKKVIKKTNNLDKVVIGGDCNEQYIKNRGIYNKLKKYDYKIAIKNTTYFIEKQMIIDNIFYRGFKIKDSYVDNSCGSRTIKNINCQLQKYGSDHFPIIAILKID